MTTKAEILKWAANICCSSPTETCGTPECLDARKAAARLAHAMTILEVLKRERDAGYAVLFPDLQDQLDEEEKL